MNKLKHEDLMSLEEYDRVRDEFRGKIVEHKKNRVVAVGEHMTVHFEDRMTMHYQVQEMLRSERIFEREGIREELDAYNPLIPDGSNWKATFMLEFPEVEIRQQMLAQLVGIEDRVYIQVADFDRVFAIADEDLERADEGKTSAVHFMRFELRPEMVAALKSGASLIAGIDHDNYQVEVSPVAANIRDSLTADLN